MSTQDPILKESEDPSAMPTQYVYAAQHSAYHHYVGAPGTFTTIYYIIKWNLLNSWWWHNLTRGESYCNISNSMHKRKILWFIQHTDLLAKCVVWIRKSRRPLSRGPKNMRVPEEATRFIRNICYDKSVEAAFLANQQLFWIPVCMTCIYSSCIHLHRHGHGLHSWT